MNLTGGWDSEAASSVLARERFYRREQASKGRVTIKSFHGLIMRRSLG